jgi:hypothetical protein
MSPSSRSVVFVVATVATACGASSQAPANDLSYTTRTSRSTTVTVHPPPPLVSTTRTSSADLDVTQKGHIPVNSLAYRNDAPGYGDADIRMTQLVRQSLASDPSLRDVATDRVRVVVVSGRALLSGYIPTLADKVAVEQRIREVKGIEGVDNELQVLR